MKPVPIKPYLMRAIHEWCSDHGYTPYLVVAVRGKMQVPMEFVKNGELTLNVSYNATRNLQLTDDFVLFSARFNGVSRDIAVPVASVVSLFARETGEGMAWEPDTMSDGDADSAAGLHAVDMLAAADVAEVSPAADSTPSEGGDKPPTPPGGRSHLRVVK